MGTVGVSHSHDHILYHQNELEDGRKTSSLQKHTFTVYSKTVGIFFNWAIKVENHEKLVLSTGHDS